MSSRSRTLLSIVALLAILAGVALVVVLWSVQGQDPEDPPTTGNGTPAAAPRPASTSPTSAPTDAGSEELGVESEDVPPAALEEAALAFARTLGASVVQCELPPQIDGSKLLKHMRLAIHGRQVTALVTEPAGRTPMQVLPTEQELSDNELDPDRELRAPAILSWDQASPDQVSGCTITPADEPVDVIVRVRHLDGTPAPDVQLLAEGISRRTDGSGQATVPLLPGPALVQATTHGVGELDGRPAVVEFSGSATVDAGKADVVHLVLDQAAAPGDGPLRQAMDQLLDDREALDRAAAQPGLSAAARSLLRQAADELQPLIDQTEQLDEFVGQTREVVEMKPRELLELDLEDHPEAREVQDRMRETLDGLDVVQDQRDALEVEAQ